MKFTLESTMARVSLTLIFVFCVGSVICGVPDRVLHRERRRITTTPKPEDLYKCADYKDFVNYNTPKTCCLDQPGPFFNTSQMTTCNKAKDKNAPLGITGYILNTIQDIKNDNFITYSSSALGKSMGKQACMAECLFQLNKNYVYDATTGEIDPNLVAQLITGNTSVYWRNLTIQKLAPYCTEIMNEYYEPINATLNATTYCNFAPLWYLQCIHFFMIGSCDINKEPTTNIHKSCAEGTNAQDHCSQPFPELIIVDDEAPSARAWRRAKSVPTGDSYKSRIDGMRKRAKKSSRKMR